MNMLISDFEWISTFDIYMCME